MKDTDPGRRDELTDAQLDQLLAETNRELLENIEATSDPSRTLAAIMARNAEQGRRGRSGRVTVVGVRGRRVLVRGRFAWRMQDSGINAQGGRSDQIIPYLVRAAAVVRRRPTFYCYLAAVAVMAVTLLALTVAAQLNRAAGIITPSPIEAGGIAAGFLSILFGSAILAAIGVANRQRTGHDPGQALAAIMRSRLRAWAVARILAADADRPGHGVSRGGLAAARDNARQLARDRELRRVLTDRDRASVLVSGLRAILDSACRRRRALDLAMDPASKLTGSALSDVAMNRVADLDRELRQRISSARDIALALVSALDERQVDVSGADLSRMNIDPELLNGAIWTHQTSWPPGVASRVRAHSTEIRPGVYQVRLGNTHDRGFLTLS